MKTFNEILKLVPTLNKITWIILDHETSLTQDNYEMNGKVLIVVKYKEQVEFLFITRYKKNINEENHQKFRTFYTKTFGFHLPQDLILHNENGAAAYAKDGSVWYAIDGQPNNHALNKDQIRNKMKQDFES